MESLDVYHYGIKMELNTNSEIAMEELEELGLELAAAAESFLRSKRRKNIVGSGTIDVFESVYVGKKT